MNIVKSTTLTIEDGPAYNGVVFQEVEFKFNLKEGNRPAFVNCYFIECSEIGEHLMDSCVVLEEAGLYGLTKAGSDEEVAKLERQLVKKFVKTVKHFKADIVPALRVCAAIIEGVRVDRIAWIASHPE